MKNRLRFIHFHIIRRAGILLLVLAMAAGLFGCGGQESTAFRILGVAGTRRYGLLFRQDDRIAPVVSAALETIAARGELSAISMRWLGKDVISLKGSLPPVQTESPQRTEKPRRTETPRETEAPVESESPARDDETEAVEEIPAMSALPVLDAGEAETPHRLIVGVESEFEPMAFTEHGVLRGMSVEIADALGRETGWEVVYQPIAPSEVGAQLSSGNIDCALGFDPASVPEGKYTAGFTYMESDVVIAVRPDSKVHSFRDTKGERIGTVNDPVIGAVLKGNDKLTRYASGATVYLSPQRCLSALDNGWCAAIAMDRIMLEHLY